MSRLTHAFMLLLVLLALPCAAQDDGQTPASDTDAVPAQAEPLIGRWYAQARLGEVLPNRLPLVVDLSPDGQFTYMPGDPESFTFNYLVNTQEALIVLYEIEGEDKHRMQTIPYVFEDGMLVLNILDDPDTERDLELTRNPEGTERHQRMRAAPGALDDNFSRNRCTARMQALRLACLDYAQEHGGQMPSSTGLLVALGYVDAEYAFTPWSDVEIPEDFPHWDDARKTDWVNTHTSFVYVNPGDDSDLDPNVMIYFDLPVSEDVELVSICLQDGDKWSRPYADANEDVREDTGHTIAQWMQTTSPGTGEMNLPQDEPSEE